MGVFGDHGLLLGKDGHMRVVLVEPSAGARTALSSQLGELGIEVASFADPHVAFLFLLGHIDRTDGVLVNGDDERRTSRLLARLEMLAAPVAVVTYSGREPGRAAAIAVAGRTARRAERREPQRAERREPRRAERREPGRARESSADPRRS